MDGAMLSCCRQQWRLITFFFSNFLLFNFGETLQNCSLSFRCTPWASRFDVKSIQRRAFFLITVAFLSAQSGLAILLWPQASTMHFLPENCCSLDFFFLIWKILCKSKRWCEKIRAILEIVRPVHLAQTAIPHSKLVKWPFSAILMVSLNFSRVSWLCPKCIDLLSCCHVIGTYITIPYSNKTHTHICVC